MGSLVPLRGGDRHTDVLGDRCDAQDRAADTDPLVLTLAPVHRADAAAQMYQFDGRARTGLRLENASVKAAHAVRA